MNGTLANAGLSPSPPEGMGRLVHRARASAITAWIIFAAGILLLLAWVGLSLAFVNDQLERNRPSDGLWIAPLVMAFFFVPLGTIFAVKGYRGRLLLLDLLEGGVSFQDNQGRVALRWDEIASVVWKQTAHVSDVGIGVDFTTGRTAKTTLQSTRGASIVVDERLPDHVKLAALVRDAAAVAMLPRYEAALSAGQRVYFGSLGIDSWGIHTHLAIPWSAVQLVRWESRGASACYVVVGTNGANLAEVGCPVPNEVILQVVLRRFGKLSDARQGELPLGDEILDAVRQLFA